MADPWPIIDPYFKDALNDSWVYATVMADIVRDLGYIEEDAEGEHLHDAIDEKWMFARGRLRAHLLPEVSSLAGPFADIAKAPLRPILAGTLYTPTDRAQARARIELGISHGVGGVTTTTMSFSNGYEMIMVDATYAAPSDTYICQVGGAGPSNKDHAVITFHEGLLRFIRGELPRPLGRPNLDWPGGFRHPHWHWWTRRRLKNQRRRGAMWTRGGCRFCLVAIAGSSPHGPVCAVVTAGSTCASPCR